MANKKQVKIEDVGKSLELATYNSPNKKFDEHQLRLIITELGKNTPLDFIIAKFKKEFKDTELSKSNIEYYKRAKKWRPSIELVRAEFSRTIGNEYFALKRNHLKELLKLYLRAKNDKFRLNILKEVRLVTEGGADGGGISIQGQGGMNIQLVNYSDTDNPRKVKATGATETIVDITEVDHVSNDSLLDDIPEDKMGGVGSNYKFAGMNEEDGTEQWDSRDKNKKNRKAFEKESGFEADSEWTTENEGVSI